MKKSIKLLALVITIVTTAVTAFAQNPYGEVNFVKVHAGMGDSYLDAMKTIKKVNNGLKASKTINSYQLYRRVLPSGSSMDFNYATLTVFPSGKEMESRKDWGPWDAPMKELSAKEMIETLTSLNTLRTVVARDLYSFRFGVGNSIKTGDYVMLSRVKVTSANMEAYEKMLETAKLSVGEAMKDGKIKGWNVWKRTFATNIDGASDFTIGFTFSTMDEALTWASGKVDLAAYFKKAYPKDDYNAFRTKQWSLREIVAQELWELVDITD